MKKKRTLTEIAFGFEFKEDPKQQDLRSPVPPTDNDGSQVISTEYNFNHVTGINFNYNPTTDIELVNQYRYMAEQPEMDSAIEEIVNDAIVTNLEKPPVSIVLDNVELSDSIKTKISEEFINICKLLDFNKSAYEIFRRWYIDGRLYYHVVVDDDESSKKKNGIKELRYIDPRQIKKIKQVSDEKDPKTGVVLRKLEKEYFLYNQAGHKNQDNISGVELSKDEVTYSHSKKLDYSSQFIISHLHKAIRPMNQLRMMEDAVVIYRITRAPERRIFYIDVGNLPKNKAQQYLETIKSKYKNKLNYNPETGEVNSKRRHLSMLEDYWLPRREGSNKTEIDTLPGGQNLSEIEDVKFFQERLYSSLNVPISRLQPDEGFNLGRSESITRDELKFSKFIQRLRTDFSCLFDELLYRQLVLKNIIKTTDWEDLKDDIYYNFLTDSHFTELKNNEIRRERLSMLNEVQPFVGVYFSKEYVWKEILKMNDSEIENMKKQMKKEEPEIEADNTDFQGSSDFGDFGQDRHTKRDKFGQYTQDNTKNINNTSNTDDLEDLKDFDDNGEE